MRSLCAALTARSLTAGAAAAAAGVAAAIIAKVLPFLLLPLLLLLLLRIALENFIYALLSRARSLSLSLSLVMDPLSLWRPLPALAIRCFKCWFVSLLNIVKKSLHTFRLDLCRLYFVLLSGVCGRVSGGGGEVGLVILRLDNFPPSATALERNASFFFSYFLANF